jgi:alkylation response protein AidB-like acyl-CoA dehydrogenase
VSAELLEDLRATTRRALSVGGGDVVDELDLAGLLIESDRGGLGLGDREMAVVSTELGHALSPSSFLAIAVLTATLLTHAESDTAADLLTALVAGRIRCAVAIADADAPWVSSRPPVTAASTADGGWLLDGTVWGISTPSRPDTILTVAGTDAGPALFAVAADVVEVAPADELDPARGLIRVALAQAPARLLAESRTAAGAIAETYRRGLLAVAAEQLGVARACLEQAVEYAKTRSQFGAPIGSFQAVKHRCAEVLLEAELADAVIDQAVQTAASVDAELAFIVATRAALSAAESCIHIHGGIGFTWEHRAHRYLRRARVNAALLGPVTVHRDAIAASVGLSTAEGVSN